MSEDYPREQRPPSTRRTRTGIPRAVVRRDIFTQAVTPFGPAPAASTPPPPATRPVSAADTSEESEADAPSSAIGTEVAVPTSRPETAKRARPSTSNSSTNSDEQEDKRLRMYLAPSSARSIPADFLEPSRSPSPTGHSTQPEVPLPRTPSPTEHPPLSEVPPPTTASPEARRTIAPSSPRASTGDTASMLSRSDSARSEGQQASASWPRDSTSYATLASMGSHDVPMGSPPTTPPPPPTATSPQPSTSYAAAAAAPPSPRRSPPRQAAQHPPPTTTGPTATAVPSTQPPRSAYPPLVVECLPNWPRHFAELSRVLGHAPNARPLARGVRFLPKTDTEFRAVQRYLTHASEQDSTISWYCYSPATEKPVKVAIRGLPIETPTDDIVAALRALGFPAEAAKEIPNRGRNGCTYHVRLAHLTTTELQELYTITELLYMPGLLVEAWRGGSKPPQCHRCQQFGHNSANCHRRIRCVRCAGEHIVGDCQRSRNEPTCANCGQAHAANDPACVHYRREARRRGINQPPPPPRRQPQNTQRAPAGAATAAAQARAPVAARTHTRAQTTTRPTTAAPAAPAAPAPVPPTTAANAATAAPTHRPAAPSAARQPPTTTVLVPPTSQPVGPTTLAPPANPPTERGLPTRRKRRRRNRAPRPPRNEPTAASTPQPRQGGGRAPAAQPPPPQPSQPQPQPAQTAPTPTAIPMPAPHSTTSNRQTATQLPTATSVPTPSAQGEERTNPDITAIVRVVVEALMTGLTTYLQGRGIMPAIAAGLAVLTTMTAGQQN